MKNKITEKRGTCWVGYKQVGMKKKGDRMVPNCVKEIYYEENGKGYGYTFEFYGENLQEAEYKGRKVKLNKIMQGDKKKFKVYVKNDKGNVVVVHFGQGGDAKGGTMRIRKSNPKARNLLEKQDTIVIIQRENQNTKLARYDDELSTCRKMVKKACFFNK